MPESFRQRLLHESRQAALAFAEDLPYLQDLASGRTLTRSEVRRAATVLRRLFVDNGHGDLPRIARPRIGELKVLGPDNLEYYRRDRTRSFRFFASGGRKVFAGYSLRGVVVEQPSRTGTNNSPSSPAEDHAVSMTLDTFLAQKVFCLDGVWITRREVIKYVANASGVHSGRSEDKADFVLTRIRTLFAVSAHDGIPRITARADPEGSVDAKSLISSADELDLVLVELAATTEYLVNSPDTERLQRLLSSELADQL